MSSEAFGDRVAFGSRDGGLTYGELAVQARRTAVWAAKRGVGRVGLVDVNSDAVPIILYGSSLAGLPFVPVNYRLADDQLEAILVRTAPSVVVVGDAVPGRVPSIDGVELLTRAQFLREIE